MGPWEYTIEAWGDTFASWQEEIHKKFNGGLRDLRSEALEGAGTRHQGRRTGRKISRRESAQIASPRDLKAADAAELNRLASSSALAALMAAWPDAVAFHTNASPFRFGWTALGPFSPLGTNFSPVRPKARPTLVPPSAIAWAASTTRRPWAST